MSRSRIACIASGLLVAAAVLLPAAPANAVAALAAELLLPSPLSVGQTGVPASIRVTNTSTDSETLGVDLIQFTPSCGTQPAPCTMPDIGVLTTSTTAVGAAGTACAGLTFDISTPNASGTVTLAPTSPPTVILSAGQMCQIAFTVDVVRVPTTDVAPGLANVQTRSLLAVSGTVTVGPNPGVTASAKTSLTTTVLKATPTISADPSPDITLGGTITNTATVTDRVEPQTGAFINFFLYRSSDTNCSTPLLEDTGNPYPSSDEPVTSEAFTPTEPGTYKWVVVYTGDANNNPVETPCNDPDQTVTVTAPTPDAPTISADPSPDITLGGTITNTATVTDRVEPQTGAFINFFLYRSSDTNCSTPLLEDTGNPYPSSDEPVTSEAFTPTEPGTYKWVVVYTGDANNNPVETPCNDPDQTVTVTAPTPDAPTISADPSPDITLGGTITNTATVTDRVEPQTGAFINFFLYRSSDTNCSTPLLEDTGNPYPSSDEPVTSEAFTPTEPGTYKWVVVYTGDANNNPVETPCNDPDQTVTVTAPTPDAPTISADPSPDITLGGTITNTATVTDRVEPQTGAFINFFLYRSSDTNCSTPLLEDTGNPYPSSDEPVTSEAFTPTEPGTYKWVVVYTGDANNNPVETPCNDPDRDRHRHRSRSPRHSPPTPHPADRSAPP